MAEVVWDDSSFQRGMDKLVRAVDHKQMAALSDVADELLRLSQLEVPLDKSFLMQSGNTEPGDNEFLVGYNTPYAARLHEHPEYKFKNGRKGKYLEEPMKRNVSIFRDVFDKKMGEVLHG